MANSEFERFTLVMADILNMSYISNEDPFRFTKRKLIETARMALLNGICQAEENIRVIRNIESDFKEYKDDSTGRVEIS